MLILNNKTSLFYSDIFTMKYLFDKAYEFQRVFFSGIKQSFCTFCRDICIEGIEPSRIHNQWKLVHLYIESVQEIVECSTTLTLSEYKLFSKYPTNKYILVSFSRPTNILHSFVQTENRPFKIKWMCSMLLWYFADSCMGDLLRCTACRDQDMRAILTLLQTVLSRQR